MIAAIATVIELSVRLAPLGVAAVRGIIGAFTRDELENMSQAQIDLIVRSHNSEIDSVHAHLKATLAGGEATPGEA